MKSTDSLKYVMSENLAKFLTVCLADYLNRNTEGMDASKHILETLEDTFLEGRFDRIEMFVKFKLQKQKKDDASQTV